MPAYNYRCEACGRVTEKVVAIATRDRKYYCKYLHLGTGSFCAGKLTRIFESPRAFLHVVESPSTVKKLKAEGKFIAGTANLREMEQFWDRKEKEADENLDRKCKKWAADLHEELGDSGLYTSESQNRSDTVPLPAELQGKV